MSKPKTKKSTASTRVTESFVTLRADEESEDQMRLRKLAETRQAENERAASGVGLPSSLI